jgi:hypothetical protein
LAIKAGKLCRLVPGHFTHFMLFYGSGKPHFSYKAIRICAENCECVIWKIYCDLY